MIRLFRSSQLLYGKTWCFPCFRNFSSLDQAEFEHLQDQIIKSRNIERLYEVIENTQNLSIHTSALRQIGVFISNGAYIKEWFRNAEYIGMIENVKKNLEDLGPNEICDLTYFLKNTNSHEIGEREEPKLFERIGFLADDGAFTIDTLAYLFHDWSFLKYSSKIFDMAVLNAIAAEGNRMNFLQIKMLLIGLNKVKHYYSNEIADTLIQMLLNKSSDDYVLAEIPELMSSLYEVSKVYPEGGMWRAIDKFENYLANNELKGEEMVKILEFYSIAKNSKAPLVQKCIAGLNDLVANNPTFIEENFWFLIKGLQTFCSRTGVKMPQELVNKIIDFKMETIEQDHINDISELCKALGYIANEIPKDLLEFFQKSVENAETIQFLQLATGLSKLDPEFNLEHYSNSLHAIRKRIVESSFISKFIMVDLIDKLEHPSAKTILADLLYLINEDNISIIGTYKLCLSFLNSLGNANLDESSMKKVQPSIRHVMETIGNNWDDKRPWFGLFKLLPLAKGNESLFEEIISTKDIPKGSVEAALERVSKADIPIKAILSIFGKNRGKPYAASQVQSMKHVSLSTDNSELEQLLTKLEEKDINRAINYDDFDLAYYRFFEAIYMKGLLFKIKTYLQEFNTYIDDFLTEHKGLYIGGMMGRAGVLESQIGLKLLEFHQNSYDLASLIRVASALPSIPDDIKETILEKIFTIDKQRSFKYFSDYFMEYLYSPLNGEKRKEQFIGELKEFIECLNEYEYDSLAYALSVFPSDYNGPHPELAEAFNGACLNKIASIAKSSSNDMKIKALNVLADLKTSNAELFNIIIGSFEDSTSYNDLKGLVKCLTKRGINNEGILQSFSEEIMKNPKEHLEDGPMIVRTLADLGLHTHPWASSLVSALAQEYDSSSYDFSSKNSYVQWIWGLLHFSIPQETIINSIEKYNSLNQKVGFNLYLLNLSNFFVESPYPVKMKFNNPLKELNSFVDAQTDFGIKPKTFKVLDDILLRKIKLLTNKNISVGKVWSPYYIPSLKTSIWPISKDVKLFNNKDFKGTFLWHKKSLEKNCKILTVDQDFLIDSPGDKVEDWMITNGIK